MDINCIFFGQFLRREGLIREGDIFEARSFQKKHNRRIGEYASEQKGWLTREQVEMILVVQEERKLRFGEVAIQMGLLEERQVSDLLKEMDDSYIFFGEALVLLGKLPKDVMIEKLKEFNLRNATAGKRARESDKASLSESRLGALFCNLKERCSYFNGRRPDEDIILKVRYCLGDFTKCARFFVNAELGPEHLSKDLQPDQKLKAMQIVEEQGASGKDT